MQVSEHIHALRIPFTIPVAPGKKIERVVYSYIIFGGTITLIDSGVSGAERVIFDYLKKNGRRPEEVTVLILSHSHPDHVGSAIAIKDAAACLVWAHEAERNWIEDTELQFRERPVPGFHSLVGGPLRVDRLLDDGETVSPAGGIDCLVMHTPGHSRGSVSLYFESEKVLFTGDAITLPNDLPIYEDISACVASIERLRQFEEAEVLLSSWEQPIRGRRAIEKRIEDGISYLRKIHESVLEAQDTGKRDLSELCLSVVHELGLPPFAVNPLVARAFASNLQAKGDPFAGRP